MRIGIWGLFVATLGFVQHLPGAPNVLVIVADDLGYAELGVQGCKDIPTPNIDSIAAAGVRFTAGYVTASYCAPSRAGFLSGRYQQRFGFEYNAIGKQNLDPKVGLPPSQKTLADRFKEAGYATAITGKWHLGATTQFHPQKRGFDEFFGFLHEGHFYLPDGFKPVHEHLRNPEPPYNQDNPILRGERKIDEPRYLTEALGREAVSFIVRHKDKPFFLYLPFNAPHSPMQITDKYYQRFAHIADDHRRIFAAMTSAMDDAIGEVLAKLREAGLEENTLIFFFSDNGGPTAELTSRNDPFSGGKGSLLEGGIRVPFLAQWKGRIPVGKVFDRPVITLDVTPTALAAAGIAAPADDRFDGVNLLPFLTGEKTGDPHESLHWRMNGGQLLAMRQGDWKFLRIGGGPGKLFNLAADVKEQNDLAALEPAKFKELSEKARAWSGSLAEPIWAPAPKGDKKGKKNKG